MIYLTFIGLFAFLGLVFGPQFLITRTLQKYADERSDFPGAGGELARHLLDDAGLTDVKIEITNPMQDHYSSDDRVVRLSESNFKGRSITAVAVATHEVAHAIQDRDGYAPLYWRQRLVKKTIIIDRLGTIVLMATPIVFAIFRSPAIIALEIAAAIGIMASTIVIHIVTLPTELDASFTKALPVLETYLPPEDMKGARAVLRAAAFTYVASALVSFLNIARWLRFLRF
jgi:Zn-dependent membrane protease YugP